MLDVAMRAKELSNMAAYTGGWTLLFIVLRFAVLRGYSSEFSNRVVSLIHALLAIFTTTWAIDNWGDPWAGIGGPTTAKQMKCLTISLSYFTYDFLTCLVIEDNLPNAFHHVATMMGLAVGVLDGTCGTELVECLFLMEISNPFMHVKFLIKDYEKKGGRLPAALTTVNEVLFVLAFFVCRLVIGPVLVYHTVASETTHVLVKAGGVGILLVSIFWFRLICQVAAYKLGLTEGKKGAKKGAKKGE